MRASRASLSPISTPDPCAGCQACVTACKERWDSGPGAARDWVIELEHGRRGVDLGLTFFPGLCNHCDDHPCTAECPTGATWANAQGVVVVDPDICIGCGYCFYACPFGAPQFPESGAFASRGKMDKCTFCAGGPVETGSAEEHRKYGSNRVAEGKLPLCAEMCSTKALLAGDADVISDIYRMRVVNRGASVLDWGVNYEKASIRRSQGMKGKVSSKG